MSEDIVKSWAQWFGGLVGVQAAPAGPEAIEMDDLAALGRLSKQVEESEARLQKEVAGNKSRPTEILDVQSYVKSEIDAFGQRVGKFNDGRSTERIRGKIDNMEKLYGEFSTKAMARATTQITTDKNATSQILGEVKAATGSGVDAENRKKLFAKANAALVKSDILIRDWTTQIAEGKGGKLAGINQLDGALAEMVSVHTELESQMAKLLPPLKSVATDPVDSVAATVPEGKVVNNPEQVLKDFKDWSVAKREYAQYKSEMQKLADFRKKVVDEWLEANLKKEYGLEYGSGKGWVAVGSSDPTSDYDISINKHGKDKKGAVKYDYQMVNEFNQAFRQKYGCETGTIFDTNLYASAPALELTPSDDESKEETAARKDIEASNDVGALMKQRRYMSGAEFNDYRNDVLAGLPKDKQEAVGRRFQAADDNFRIAVQKTIEALGPLVEAKVKKLATEPPSKERDHELSELKALVQKRTELSQLSGSDLITGAEEMEKLAQDMEHACKDSNTQATNDIYVQATGGVRQAEGKITDLKACVAGVDEVRQAAKKLADLKGDAPPQERAKAQAELDAAKQGLAKQVEKLGRNALKGVPKDILDGKFDAAAKTLASESPELFKELGSALSLAMFFANEAYQAGGPFRHVVFAGQAVEQDVKNNDERAKPLNEEMVKAEKELKALADPKGADKSAAEELEKKIKGLAGRIKPLVEEEREKRRQSLSAEECLDSFNEQLGDFLKDLAHYGDADAGIAIIQSSKYLDRLLDAAKLLDSKQLFDGTQLKTEIGKQVRRLSDIQNKLIKARKGQITMKPNAGEEAGFDEVEQRRAMACEVMREWGIKSVASLHRTYADLGKQVNIEVRKRIAMAA